MSEEDFFVDTATMTLEDYKNMKEEIERLSKQIEEYQKALDETTSEKVDLYSIIKEVREYIEEHTENVELNIYGMPPVIRAFRGNTQTLLEILDKENK